MGRRQNIVGVRGTGAVQRFQATEVKLFFT